MPTEPDHADLESLLDSMLGAGVECIVVGGAAAVLHGAPVTTQDLYIVPRRTPESIDRILRVLEHLDARVRDPAGRDLGIDRAALIGGGQLKLTTNRGPLDLLGSLHDGRSYDELLPHTVGFTEGSMIIRVVDLPTLIEIKSTTGRTCDKLVVPLLLALLRDTEPNDSSDPQRESRSSTDDPDPPPS